MGPVFYGADGPAFAHGRSPPASICCSFPYDGTQVYPALAALLATPNRGGSATTCYRPARRGCRGLPTFEMTPAASAARSPSLLRHGRGPQAARPIRGGALRRRICRTLPR